MQTTQLGQTGLTVSRIGLGLAALGRPGYINLGHCQDLTSHDVAAMEAHTHEVLDTAWEAGIRYFDAARSYGRAEAFLASWLQSRKIGSEKVTVGSKWGYTYTANWQVEAKKHEVKEHTLPVLQRQVAETFELLGEYLDLYQIHSATLDTGVLEDTTVLCELAQWKERGLKIGLSLSGPEQKETLEKAMEVQVNGIRLFDCVQATWNILEPSVGEVLKKAHDSGMGVIVKETLANGRLTSRNQMPEFAAKRNRLQEIAERHNVGIDAIALGAVLRHPWANLVLTGAAASTHLHANLAALEVNFRQEEFTILEGLAESPSEYWQTRANLEWN
ncbi:MAG: aldo/keto reductase [Gemmataceae bacterium]